MLPLVIRSLPGMNASFLSTTVVDLPVVVETAGFILPFHSEFRVWINSPGPGKTLQFRVTAAEQIIELDPLPLVAAGTVECGDGFIITGADRNGLPLAMGTDRVGNILWQQAIEGLSPYRWPMPGCMRKPVILWQTEQARVELADVGASGVLRRTSFLVGGPPLDLAVAHEYVWAVWSDASGIFASAAADADIRRLQLFGSYASEVAVGVWTDCIFIAWGRANTAFLVTKRTGSGAFSEPLKCDLAGAVGGALRIIPGEEPLIFASRSRVDEREPPQVTSVLTAPGVPPITIEGMVHAVASRETTIVLLGDTKLQFLRHVR